VDVQRILVVEDDPVARLGLCEGIERAGFDVREAPSAAEARKAFSDFAPDVVILDLGLPDDSGHNLAREFRAATDPGIIVVTARDDRIDRLVCLELGADAYHTKPVDTRELVVQIRNLTRRLEAREKDTGSQLGADGWRLNIPARRLSAPDGTDVKLTRGEFETLAALAENVGQVMSRDQILDQTSADNIIYDRTVDAMIRRLRKKVEADPGNPRYIITVHGVGYLFAPSD
jgi:two-component system, OmpR family, torCAD operon response regulator TorR